MQEMQEILTQGTYTVPVTLEGGQPTIAIPRGLGFDGVRVVKLEKRGDDLLVHALQDEQPSWESLADEPKVDITPSRRPWTSLIGKLKVKIVPDRTPIGDPERFLKDFQ